MMAKDHEGGCEPCGDDTNKTTTAMKSHMQAHCDKMGFSFAEAKKAIEQLMPFFENQIPTVLPSTLSDIALKFLKSLVE